MSIEEMSENLNLSFVPTETSSGKDTAMIAKEMGCRGICSLLFRQRFKGK